MRKGIVLQWHCPTRKSKETSLSVKIVMMSTFLSLIIVTKVILTLGCIIRLLQVVKRWRKFATKFGNSKETLVGLGDRVLLWISKQLWVHFWLLFIYSFTFIIIIIIIIFIIIIILFFECQQIIKHLGNFSLQVFLLNFSSTQGFPQRTKD